ncbi:hypothetical protein BC629DRAFT_767730 [Irpex lacteus]|nr:hypothetical protein BC629DRAFT_767730 [Irpex lacteus]
MHYTHRSKARASLDEIVQTPAEPPVVKEVQPAAPSIKEPSLRALLSHIPWSWQSVPHNGSCQYTGS